MLLKVMLSCSDWIDFVINLTSCGVLVILTSCGIVWAVLITVHAHFCRFKSPPVEARIFWMISTFCWYKFLRRCFQSSTIFDHQRNLHKFSQVWLLVEGSGISVVERDVYNISWCRSRGRSRHGLQSLIPGRLLLCRCLEEGKILRRHHKLWLCNFACDGGETNTIGRTVGEPRNGRRQEH